MMEFWRVLPFNGNSPYPCEEVLTMDRASLHPCGKVLSMDRTHLHPCRQVLTMDRTHLHPCGKVLTMDRTRPHSCGKVLFQNRTRPHPCGEVLCPISPPAPLHRALPFLHIFYRQASLPARFLTSFGMTTAMRGIKRRLVGGFATNQPIPLFLEERASFRTK
jgi:hypothetical protein